MITCARCNVVAPIDADELTDHGGDSDLLPLIVPPCGWLPYPDDGGPRHLRGLRGVGRE